VKIAVVDYGLGNIYSVMAALQAVGLSAAVDLDGNTIEKSTIALLPGVAAFGPAMRNLRESGQGDALSAHFVSGKKLIGLCLGAQMFLDSSEEAPGVKGFGFVSGEVVRLNEQRCTVPNQGWLRVADATDSSIATSLGALNDNYFYFSHSYRMQVGSSVTELGKAISGTEPILAVYREGNVLGVQFHPERSGEMGLRFLSATLLS
jgi:glutamine amidotransferase